MEKEKNKGREICLKITTDKAGVINDAEPFTALLTALGESKLSYHVVTRQIRENGYYMDTTHPEKDVWYFKKPLIKAEYILKDKKKRLKNLKK